MDFLEKVNLLLNRVLLVLGSAAVLLLMSVATINVVLRYPFKVPWRGTYEVVGLLGAIVIAFALGFTQKRKDHIVVDILTEKFPLKVNRVLEGISYFLTTIFFTVVSWQIFAWGTKIMKSGEVSETLKIIFHPFVFCVCLGFIVFSFTLLVDFLKIFKTKENQ
jgi:TRAP-type C4-dicarboxylate transport system permease small subunit